MRCATSYSRLVEVVFDFSPVHRAIIESSRRLILLPRSPRFVLREESESCHINVRGISVLKPLYSLIHCDQFEGESKRRLLLSALRFPTMTARMCDVCIQKGWEGVGPTEVTGGVKLSSTLPPNPNVWCSTGIIAHGNFPPIPRY